MYSSYNIYSCMCMCKCIVHMDAGHVVISSLSSIAPLPVRQPLFIHIHIDTNRQKVYRRAPFAHFFIFLSLYCIVSYCTVHVYLCILNIIQYNTVYRVATSTKVYTNNDMTGELRFVSFLFNIKMPNEIQQML